MQSPNKDSCTPLHVCVCVSERVHAPPDAPPLYGLLNKSGAVIRQCIHHPITATNPAPGT